MTILLHERFVSGSNTADHFILFWSCVQMIKFPPAPPISRALLPTLVHIAQMDLILPRCALILPRIPPPTPVLYAAVTHPFLGHVRTQTSPKPSRNTPFPGLNLNVGKMKYSLGNLDPNWAKCLKSGQNVSRSGQNVFIHCVQIVFQLDQSKSRGFCLCLYYHLAMINLP